LRLLIIICLAKKEKRMLYRAGILLATIFFTNGIVCKSYEVKKINIEREDVFGVEDNMEKKAGIKNQGVGMPQDMPVKKYVLKNGLTVLVREVHTIPKVSLQMWYNVGSKDEKSGERGIAHLIEHMIFKGTDKLSESDINTISYMLSSGCNAFTSHDYTGYLFNVPSQNWKHILPIVADCMTNCTFKDDMLNSEMKAVIQELKLYRDKHIRSLLEEMVSIIFTDHPYHNPIIGYKQDLWSVSSKDLHAFYKKHYVPNNAALVVTGDVKADEVFALVEEHFGAIPANSDYEKERHYHNKDIVSKSVTMYRDIKQPMALFAYVVPGITEKKEVNIEIIEWILGKGKGSRLYKKLVNELQLATSVETFYDDLFDHGIFFIACDLKHTEDVVTIQQEIQKQIDELVSKGIADNEFTRAIKNIQMAKYNQLEDTEHQSYEIGKHFWATGDENYMFIALNQPHEKMKKETHEILAQYFRPTIMHTGLVLSLPESERGYWEVLQAESDKEDERILSARVRNTALEPPRYAKTLKINDPGKFAFPKAKTSTLSNGVKLFTHHNDTTPKIDLVLAAQQVVGITYLLLVVPAMYPMFFSRYHQDQHLLCHQQ